MQDFAGVFIGIVCYFAYLCTAVKFAKSYLEISWINEILFFAFFFGGKALIGAAGGNGTVWEIFPVLLGQMLFLGLVVLLFRGGAQKKILIGSVLLAVTTMVENFSVSVFSALLLWWMHTVKQLPSPVLDGQSGSLAVCLGMVAVILAVSGMSKHGIAILNNGTGKWQTMLSVPLLVLTAVIDVANWGASNGILVRSGGNMGLYYDQMFGYAEFCVLTALSMFAAGFYVLGMNSIYLEQRKNSQYQSQIDAYRMLKEQYSQSERVRHDLKNHVLALHGLLEKREWEKMGRYLKNMESQAGLENGGEVTGNRVVDVLLHQKGKRAKGKGIDWECDVQMPKSCGIDEFDLCVLFGNILDNAVEACERQQDSRSHSTGAGEKQQFIRIQAKAVKKCFLLEVRNSTGMEDKRAAGVCAKNPKGHGIGLLNVRDVVEKYDGVMETEVLDGVFTVSVLVPLA